MPFANSCLRTKGERLKISICLCNVYGAPKKARERSFLVLCLSPPSESIDLAAQYRRCSRLSFAFSSNLLRKTVYGTHAPYFQVSAALHTKYLGAQTFNLNLNCNTHLPPSPIRPIPNDDLNPFHRSRPPSSSSFPPPFLFISCCSRYLLRCLSCALSRPDHSLHSLSILHHP